LVFGMGHPWGKEIKVCSNKVRRVMYGPRGLNFYKVIYWEMLKKIFSRTTRPISTKLKVGIMLGGWEFGFVQIKVLAQ